RGGFRAGAGPVRRVPGGLGVGGVPTDGRDERAGLHGIFRVVRAAGGGVVRHVVRWRICEAGAVRQPSAQSGGDERDRGDVPGRGGGGDGGFRDGGRVGGPDGGDFEEAAGEWRRGETLRVP